MFDVTLLNRIPLCYFLSYEFVWINSLKKSCVFCFFFCVWHSLQPFPVPENKTGPMTIDYLTKRLLALGAIQTGGFLVDCETFHSMPPLGKSLRKVLHRYNILIMIAKGLLRLGQWFVVCLSSYSSSSLCWLQLSNVTALCFLQNLP